jgi:hypothetical protein
LLGKSSNHQRGIFQPCGKRLQKPDGKDLPFYSWEIHYIYGGKSTISTVPFSIAMFVYQRLMRKEIAWQISLICTAQVLVGAHGANMANMLFAPDGMKVVEIVPQAGC